MHSQFRELTKSKGLMDEEAQFVMSQIDLLSEKESGAKKRKRRGPNLRLPNTSEPISAKKQVPF
jgi:hypothetical protein